MTTMRYHLTLTLCALMASASSACSEPDGTDMKALEEAIEKSAVKGPLTMDASRSNAKKWLNDKAPTDRVVNTKCEERSLGEEDSEWKEVDIPYAASFVTSKASDLLFCITTRLTFDYADCINYLVLKDRNSALEVMKRQDPHGVKNEYRCTSTPVAEYDPKNVPADTDSQRITTYDIAKYMVTLPVAPPGIAWEAEGVGAILVQLCALGVGYGCPDNPQYPGDHSDR